MTPRIRHIFQLVALSCFILVIGQAAGTSIAPVKVEDLFKQADVVAVVKILSGDSESYPVTVYKAEVVTAFKGVKLKERIFFGPFVSYGVGSEYVVFLNRSREGMKPLKEESGLAYGTIPIFYQIMYGGYSVLESGYECVFDGKETSQACDYSVRLNPEQIVLPSMIKQFPPGEAGPVTNYHKWVKKSEFLVLLEHMKQR